MAGRRARSVLGPQQAVRLDVLREEQDATQQGAVPEGILDVDHKPDWSK